MSPRSAEFLKAAKERLAIASNSLQSPAPAISLAYYAMLYAARAALSERDIYAKTHAGTWNLFQQEFVDSARFPGQLLSDARSVQREREDADYEAWSAPPEEARRVIELASEFVNAVEALIAS